MSNARQHIHGFNAIRAISVILVMLSHVAIIAHAGGFWQDFFRVFNAAWGVQAFFILSGFLITSLLVGEYQRSGRVNIRQFLIRRALRILPLYYAAILVAVVWKLLGAVAITPDTLLYAMSYLYNFVPAEANMHYLSHVWSLAVEQQFYLVWPFLAALFLAKPYRLIAVALALIALCVVVIHDGSYSPRATIPAIYPIMIGATLALLLTTGAWHALLRRLLATHAAWMAGAVLISLPLSVSQLPVFYHETLPPLGIGLLVAWVYLNQQSPVVRRMDWGPIGYIGVISYGLYVWQGLFTGNGPYRNSAMAWPPSPYTGALLTFIIAPISYHVFEKPFLRLKRHQRATARE